ncbi:MAG: hypothetical protein P0Y64_07855 [Candidatus Sphingomonas colombiensis]|nr:hypothetical protein [Sphingomonas sp.]WEK44688.1 MAG: hypothetical protein P0Y64_07855 [Sphingomonas sp.]
MRRSSILLLLVLAGCSTEPANVTSRTGTAEVRSRAGAIPDNAAMENSPAPAR